MSHLLLRVGARVCGLPVAHVVETMRPLPIERLVGAPPFVLGVAIIRGSLAPVIDLAMLLGSGDASPPNRFVTLRVGDRRVALAVQSVIGIRSIEANDMTPPLLRTASAHVVDAIANLDQELLLILRATTLLSEETWGLLREATP
jgi:purine-binding chemotaxis protein CheW